MLPSSCRLINILIEWFVQHVYVLNTLYYCMTLILFFGFLGGDLLVSLTSAFDKKLKSLSIPSDSVDVDVEENQQVTRLDDEQAEVQTYRDPSLHRSLERRSQYITEKHVSHQKILSQVYDLHSNLLFLILPGN